MTGGFVWCGRGGWWGGVCVRVLRVCVRDVPDRVERCLLKNLSSKNHERDGSPGLATMSAPPLREGDLVRLFGLEQNTEFNGREGSFREHHSGSKDGGAVGAPEAVAMSQATCRDRGSIARVKDRRRSAEFLHFLRSGERPRS